MRRARREGKMRAGKRQRTGKEPRNAPDARGLSGAQGSVERTAAKQTKQEKYEEGEHPKKSAAITEHGRRRRGRTEVGVYAAAQQGEPERKAGPAGAQRTGPRNSQKQANSRTRRESEESIETTARATGTGGGPGERGNPAKQAVKRKERRGNGEKVY